MTRPRKPGSPKPYTTGEIAEELGVNVSTVIKMLERGTIPREWSDKEHQRGRRLVKVKDWRAYLAANKGGRS